MPLRCLVFSSNEEVVKTIFDVLSALEIDGEYCPRAVDAVERVSTGMFRIVITDWNEQPEAAFLLKTARDLKAAHRPLTLAIAGEQLRAEALQAGANSILLDPIRVEQVRDTISTACELLRVKQQAAARQNATLAQSSARQQPASPKAQKAVAATAAGTVSAPATLPLAVTQAPETTFRAGEFLQSPFSTPGTQFDTETDSEVQKSMDQAEAEAAGEQVDALTNLEPTASAVQEASPKHQRRALAPKPSQPTEPTYPQPGADAPFVRWSSLQARLGQTSSPPVEQAAPPPELLSYQDAPSCDPSSRDGAAQTAPAIEERQLEGEQESALTHESSDVEAPVLAGRSRSKVGIIVLATILAAGAVVGAVPRTRTAARSIAQRVIQAADNWLNPQPAPLPEVAEQHESFRPPDDYKLPAPANTPDANTDPSQINVVPVVDPTAKTDKNSATSSPAVAANPDQPASGQPAQPPPSEGVAGTKSPAAAGQGASTSPAPEVAAAPGQTAMAQPRPQMRAAAAPAPPPAALRPASEGGSAGIPSSLKSQLAPATPAAGGAMPLEEAMDSIEPVKIPDSALELQGPPVEPEYPAAAKGKGLRGSVVLQVLISRDGAVQDAKFLQGSLVFARSAIDAVKQWRFKPYFLNGRAVSVQSSITLSFKPPA